MISVKTRVEHKPSSDTNIYKFIQNKAEEVKVVECTTLSGNYTVVYESESVGCAPVEVNGRS